MRQKPELVPAKIQLSWFASVQKFVQNRPQINSPLDDGGLEPIPDGLVPRKPIDEVISDSERTSHSESVRLPTLMNKSEEVPIFMRHVLSELSGMKRPTLNDFFWSNNPADSLHQLFTECLFMVDRQKKRPSYFRTKATWEQPIYVLLRRDGTYLCACCSAEENLLVIHSQAEGPQRPMEFLDQQEAEVIGL